MALIGEVSGPFLQRVLQILQQLLSNDLEFREYRAKNSPLAVYFDQQTAWTTASGVYKITEAQDDSQYFTEALIVFEQTSGLGRYMVTALSASNTVGFGVASGASFIRIVGQQNIKNFSLSAQAGETLVFARICFK